MDKHIEELKQYDTEKRLEEVMCTDHYGVHVHAMTKEALHSKSAIAIELAWRDLQISNLLAKLEAAEQELIKPLPIGELIHRLEGQTYRKWYDDDELNKWRERAEAAEARLLVPVKLPDDGMEDCINMWPDNWRNDFDTGYNFGVWRCEQNIKAAGYPVEGGSDEIHGK